LFLFSPRHYVLPFLLFSSIEEVIVDGATDDFFPAAPLDFGMTRNTAINKTGTAENQAQRICQVCMFQTHGKIEKTKVETELK